MTETTMIRSFGRQTRSGGIAGAVSSIGFALLHQIFISNIWFSIVPMLAAGALSGICLAWGYWIVIERPSVGSWIRYNGPFMIMLMLLGLASVLVFEPQRVYGHRASSPSAHRNGRPCHLCARVQ